jgi:hypothetical protein
MEAITAVLTITMNTSKCKNILMTTITITGNLAMEIIYL